MLNTYKLLLAFSLPFCLFSCQKEPADNKDAASIEALRASVKNHLWAQYPFNGNLNDVSGNNRHITDVSNIIFSQDTWGNENATIEFNGTNSYAVIDEGKNFPEGDYSISFFIMPKNIKGALFEKANYLNGSGFSFSLMLTETNSKGELMYAANKADIPCNNLISLTNSNIQKHDKLITADAWYHIVIVSQNGVIKTYINCYNVATATFANNITKHCKDAPFRLGISSMGNKSPFMGKMDNLRIFTKALTDLEIEHLFWSQY